MGLGCPGFLFGLLQALHGLLQPLQASLAATQFLGELIPPVLFPIQDVFLGIHPLGFGQDLRHFRLEFMIPWQ